MRLSFLLVLLPVAVTPGGCGAAPPIHDRDRLAGNDVCAGCHEEEARYCRYGAHRGLQCERCHGSGALHARGESGSRPEMARGGVALCLSCHHEESPSPTASTIRSFEDHLRKLEEDHRIQLDREKSGRECTFCHDPHLLE